MEGKHSTLRLYTPIMERSSVSFSLRGRLPLYKAHCPMDLTCSCREEGQKLHKLALKDFKETLLLLDRSSDIHRLFKQLPPCLECQVNMGNQQGTKTKQNLPKNGLYGSEIYRKRRRGERRAGKSCFNIKMASGNPLKSKRQSKLKTVNYPDYKQANEDLSDSERDLMPNQQDMTSIWNLNPAIEFLYFPKRPLSNMKHSEENDSDHSDYDNLANYEAKSGQVSQIFEEHRKETAACTIWGEIEEVEGIMHQGSLTSCDMTKDNDRFMSFKHLSKISLRNDNKDMKYNDNKPLLTKELRSLGEALSQSLQQALKVEDRNSVKENYQHAKVLRRPQYLPLNLCYSEANSPSISPASPILSSLLTTKYPTPEPQRETWSCSTNDVMGDCSKTNEQWMNWLSEYGSVYTDVSNSKDSADGLPYSDEALCRREEVWQQEVEQCLILSHPDRPKHVDFLHLTALEEEDITPLPSPPPPPLPPPLSREPGSESPTDAEDWTPGRLQAVWPPLQEEEKVGLKYTEAEHQAALLQLKRECKEELEKIQVRNNLL